ncbi:hypothetical protein BGX27_000624 [Mortierella sp. AM989]|nr:hypothetical protein BGX27_000624 [Mortierella sp. AM989]
MTLLNVQRLEDLNGKNHLLPTPLPQLSNQTGGSSSCPLANCLQTTCLNLNSSKQWVHPSRYYPSPDLDSLDICDPEYHSHWPADLVYPSVIDTHDTPHSVYSPTLGNTPAPDSNPKYEPIERYLRTPSSLCGEPAQSPTLSPLSSNHDEQGPDFLNLDSVYTETPVLSRDFIPNRNSSTTFISGDFSPSSLEEHFADIDSDDMTFLNAYRAPKALRYTIAGDLPYSPEDFVNVESYIPDDIKLDEYRTYDYAEDELHQRNRVTFHGDNVPPPFKQNDRIQTPQYSYEASTPGLDGSITPSSSIDPLASPIPCHSLAQGPTAIRPTFVNMSRTVESMAMEFESTMTPPNAYIDLTQFSNGAFYISTPGYYPNDVDDELPYIDDMSQCSSPGYLPVDINTLNSNLDPDEDCWVSNPIEHDYYISQSG